MKVCLVVAIAGAIGLFAFSYSLQPYRLSISTLTDNDLGKRITVNGTVRDPVVRNGTAFFELQDNGRKVNAVLFKAAPLQTVFLQAGMLVQVTGRLTMYRGSAEIAVEEIRPIK